MGALLVKWGDPDVQRGEMRCRNGHPPGRRAAAREDAHGRPPLGQRQALRYGGEQQVASTGGRAEGVHHGCAGEAPGSEVKAKYSLRIGPTPRCGTPTARVLPSTPPFPPLLQRSTCLPRAFAKFVRFAPFFRQWEDRHLGCNARVARRGASRVVDDVLDLAIISEPNRDHAVKRDVRAVGDLDGPAQHHTAIAEDVVDSQPPSFVAGHVVRDFV